MNHDRFFLAARAVALAGPGLGPKNRFRHGCVLVKGKSIIASGFNSLKENITLRRWYRYSFLHAESAAILHCGIEKVENTTLYVVRVNRLGELSLSKPCEGCQNFIDFCGIKRVYYTTGVGSDWEILKP